MLCKHITLSIFSNQELIICYSSGDEGVASRHLICKILETLASQGYYATSGLDITRKDNDKSLLLFQQGVPMQATFMCLSLNDTDKVKLIAAPPNVVQVSKNCFNLLNLMNRFSIC